VVIKNKIINTTRSTYYTQHNTRYPVGFLFHSVNFENPDKTTLQYPFNIVHKNKK